MAHVHLAEEGKYFLNVVFMHGKCMVHSDFYGNVTKYHFLFKEFVNQIWIILKLC